VEDGADASRKPKTKLSKPVLEGRSSVIELNRKLAAAHLLSSNKKENNKRTMAPRSGKDPAASRW